MTGEGEGEAEAGWLAELGGAEGATEPLSGAGAAPWFFTVAGGDDCTAGEDFTSVGEAFGVSLG